MDLSKKLRSKPVTSKRAAPHRDTGYCESRLSLELLEPRLLLATASVQDLSTLSFEPNVGQAAEQIDFVARGLDYSLSLASDGAILRLSAVADRDPEATRTDSDPANRDFASQVHSAAVLQTRWVNGNSEADATGLQQLPHVTNYLFGDEHTYTGIANYAQVRYEEVYTGIDLVYYGREGELEYDWVVNPGADPAQIVMAFDGMDTLSVDDQGRLVFETSAGTLLQQAPVVYQDTDGGRQMVDAHYKLKGSDEVAFQLGTYDPNQTLVIDPVLLFSTYLGGSPGSSTWHGAGNDSASGIAVDDEGNTYITGTTWSTGFPIVNASGIGSEHPHANDFWIPGPVAFVTKLDPAGDPVYSTYVGKTFSNERHRLELISNDIAVDSDGAVYIVGSFSDMVTEFREGDPGHPWLPSSFTPLFDHEVPVEYLSGAFAASLDRDGASLRYGGDIVFFGSESAIALDNFNTGIMTTATGVVVDESGNAFITGTTNGLEFPTAQFDLKNRSTFQNENGARDANGAQVKPVPTKVVADTFDAFVVRLNEQGNIANATYLGGRLDEFGDDIALDQDGNVVVVGSTSSGDFPRDDSNARLRTDGFIIVLNSEISEQLLSTSIGGFGFDEINSVAVGNDGHFYVAGATKSRCIPEILRARLVDGQREPFQQELAGPPVGNGPLDCAAKLAGGDSPDLVAPSSDGFVARLAIGDDGKPQYDYFTYLGGSDKDIVWGIDVDSSGSALVTGQTNSVDFPVKDTIPEIRGKYTDAFVTKLSPLGSELTYSALLGGGSTDVGRGIAVDSSGSAHIAGWTSNVACILEFPIGGPVEIPPEECLRQSIRPITRNSDLFPTQQNSFQREFKGGVAGVFDVHPKDAFVAKFAERGALVGVSKNHLVGVPFEDRVAIFKTPRLDAKPGDFLASIDWGDGSPPEATNEIFRLADDPQRWEVVGRHEYKEPGAYPILVTVFDTERHISGPDGDANLLDPAVNFNVSRLEGEQNEPTIALDPTNPARIFVAAENEYGLNDGIFAAYSTDDGRTWTSRLLADGNDGLPPGARNPVATFDQFGNLFLTYLSADRIKAVVLVSTDGGKTFEPEPVVDYLGVAPDLREPAVATGPSTIGDGSGSIWVAFRDGVTSSIVVLAAPVEGLGAVGPKHEERILAPGLAADIKVGPDGQVMLIWQTPIDGVSEIFASLDPDGLKQEPFQSSVPIATTFAGPRAHMAWDQSGGPNHGRVYVVYADIVALDCKNNGDPVPFGTDFSHTNICITSSQDDGNHWSSPQRLNSEQVAGSARRDGLSVAVNQTNLNGVLAVGWYEEREEKTRFHVAASNDGGKTFHSNVVSSGTSRVVASDSFLSFQSDTGALYSAWEDNSQLLVGNPDQVLSDIAVAATGIMNVRLPRPKIRPLAILGVEGTRIPAAVATFTHPDPSRKATDFTADIDWGDGNVSPGTVSFSDSVFTVSGAHTYANEGAYTVWVTVTDKVTKLDTAAISNISEIRSHEADGVIAIDPTDPNRVFAASVSVSSFGSDVLTSYSNDGGVNWNTSIVVDDSEGLPDTLPAGCCHPAAAFDQFGNLFFAYRDTADNTLVALSTDGGETFPFSNVIPGADDPFVATGPGGAGAPGSVWIIHSVAGAQTRGIAVTGAAVYEKDNVEALQHFVVAPLEDDGLPRNAGDIAIGPQGEVLAMYIAKLEGDGPAAFYAHLDPDGLGPEPFGPAIRVTETSIFPSLSLQTAQYSRDITAGANLAWDRTRGEFGRLYMTFTDVIGNPFDADIFLVYSDDAGRTWTGGFLFNVAGDQALLLDKRMLSDDLKAAFLDHGLELSQDARVHPDPISFDLWRIIDGDSRYVVRPNPEQDLLDVERERIRVNPTGEGASQFYSSIAVDSETRNVAVGWYSTIGDPTNKTTVYRMAASSDGGRTFSDPLTVSPGRTDAMQSGMSDYASDYQYGDYNRIAFVEGIVQPIWADNSSELPEYPLGEHFEIANARVGIAHVSGIPPIVQANTLTVTEGSEFTKVVATFTDPDPDGEAPSDFEALIEWGDGSDEMGTINLVDGVYRVTGTHEYEKKGTYETTVSITNLTSIYSPPTPAQGTANVNDAPLVPVGYSFRVTEDEPFSTTIAFFNDHNRHSVAGDFTATINWGDNSASIAGVIEVVGIEDGVKVYGVLNEDLHTYFNEQTYTATVTIEEIGGVTIHATSQITSGDPPISPVPQGQGPDEINALEGVPYTGPDNAPAEGSLPFMQGPLDEGDSGLAQFEVLGTVDTYEGAYSAEIDWDDGTFTFPADVSRQGNVFTVTGNHAFQTGGTLFPTVTLFDDSGGSAVVTLVAHVGRNVTSDVATSVSGLTFNPATNLFHGNLSVLNTSNSNLPGPFLIAFTGLPPNVDLVNQSGVTNNGDPYIESNQGILFVGQSLPSLPIQFSAPAQSDITYAPVIYAGVPDLDSSNLAAAQAAAFGNAPDATSGVSFESNQGQTDEEVDFLAHGTGYTIFLTPQEAVVRLDTETVDDTPTSRVVHMRFVDAQPNPLVVGVGQQPGASNYFMGNDPSEWKTGIRRYAKVRYHDLYPGIDLVYYGNEGELEYDWVVDPGADPDDIVLDFVGVDGLKLDEEGHLLVQVGDDELVLQEPVLYQPIDDTRVPVSGGYTLLDQNRVGFEIGPYDSSRTLVVDPVLVYSTYLGGKSSEDGRDVAVDSAGNSYVTGFTTALDFPLLNPLQSKPYGFTAFVTKLNASGLPVYSTYLGGRGAGGPTFAYGIAVDDAGHAYVVGETCAADFPIVNAFQPTLGDASCGEEDGGGVVQDRDGFVTKLAVDGSALEYSTYLGGSAFDRARDVDVDALGSAYVTGETGSLDFPIHQALQPQRDPGTFDAFITKFAPDGSALEYSTFLGGSGDDTPLGIAVDANGNAYVTGTTLSVDFPTANAFLSDAPDPQPPGPCNPIVCAPNTAFNAFATKINSDGTALAYSTYLGGSDYDDALDVAVDTMGNASITGRTLSADLPTLNPLQATIGEGFDAFVVKLDSLGNGIHSTYFGGSGDDEAWGIAAGPNGQVLITGRTTSSDLPVRRPIQSFHRGDWDGFVASLPNDGQELSYATYLGGSDEDRLYGIAVDEAGDAFVVGVTRSHDLRTVNAAQPTNASVCQSEVFGCDVRENRPTDLLIAKIAAQGSGDVVVTNRAVSATEGVEFTKVVATFSDTDSDMPDDYVATIQWGDGSTSQGAVAGDGNGHFEIFGSHTYDRFGTYPLTVSVLDKDGSVVRPTRTVDDGNGFHRYQVKVDTTDLEGSAGFIRLQFNPAITSQGSRSVAELTGFATDGFVADVPQLLGGAMGSLQGTVSLQNTSLLNQFTQAFRVGTEFTFDVLFTSDEVDDDPNPHSFGKRFAVQLFDADGTTPLLTDHPSGAAFSIDVTPDGSASANVYPGADGRVAATTTLVSEVVVGDAPFDAEDVAIDAREGEEFTGIVARFNDSNPLTTPDDFTATIDWGDGFISTGVITKEAPDQFVVVGTHTYAKFGEYPLSVLVESQGGRTATAFGAPLEVLEIHAARPTVVHHRGDSALVADINQDGLADVIVAAAPYTSDQISLLLGRGDSTFLTHQQVSAGLQPSAVALGDFNNDGRHDVVVGGGADRELHVLLLGEDDNLRDPVLAGQNVGFPDSFATADLNHDGNLDLVANLGCAPFCGDSIAVLLGRGDGTFGAPTLVRAETGPVQVLVEDVNSDNQPDIVVRNDIAKSVSVLLGRGDGTFASALTTSSVSSGFFSINLGDVNSDGNTDLALADGDGIVVRLGNGDGTFGAGTVVAPGGMYVDVDVIDFNGDAKLDLVAADRGSPDVSPHTPGGVHIALGNGDGSFQPVSRFTGPTHPNDLQFADFDGDGVLDVATIEDLARTVNGDAILSVVRGDGNGGLIAPLVQVISASGPATFPNLDFALSADMNRDGRDDLVSLTRSVGAIPVIVQLSNVDGTLGSPLVFESGGSRPGAGELADLNGDSIPDLVVADEGDTGLDKPRVIGVLLGNGDGTFAELDTYTVTTRLAPTDIAVGDVDEDGTPDVILATRNASPLLLGNGDGTFKSPTSISLGSFAIQKMVLADFNGDDHLDIAGLETPSNQPGRAVVFLGNGNGTFQRGTATPVGAGPSRLATGDFNGDGMLDIVVTHRGDLIGAPGIPSLAILLGIGDGTFEPMTETEVLGPALAVHTADFDKNGQVDIAALVQLGRDATKAIALFFNPMDGTLPEPMYFHTSSTDTRDMTVGDFNGDGGFDIGTANGDQSTISIILNAVTKSGAQVSNVPLDAEGTELNPIVNVEFTTNVASFTDANPFSTSGDFSATIEWGDDSTTQGTVVSVAAGRFDILGTHAYAATGDYALTVSVMDDGDAGTTATSAAHVSMTDLPIVATGTSLTVEEDAFFSEIIATFTDQDPSGTVHDFAATIEWGDGESSPGQIVTNPVQGFDVVGAHTYDLPGDYAVSVVIRSLGGESTLVDSTATAVGVNDAPVFTSEPEMDVIEGSSYGYLITVRDEDDAAADLTIGAASAPGWLDLNDHGDGTATLSGVPQNRDVGSHSVELNVTDDDGASSTQLFTIVVANLFRVNDQEFVVPENSPSGTFVGTIVVGHDGRNDDKLSYSIVEGNGSAAFAVAESTGALTVIDSGQLDFETSPTFELVVSVSNAKGGSAQGQVTVNLINVNEAPVISIPTSQDTEEDVALVFNSLNGNPISIADEDMDGSNIKVRLTAIDGTIHLANGSGLRFLGTALGSQVTMFGSQTDINAAFEGLVFNPAPNFFGSTSLQVAVSDLGGSGAGIAQTDDDVIEITVAPVNDQPTFDPIADIEMLEDAGLLSLPITGIFAGAANEAKQIVSLTATSNNQGLIAPPLISGSGATRVLNLAPVLNANGTTTITITAVDDGGTTANGQDTFSRQFTLTVLPVNDLPSPSDDHYEVDEDSALDVPAPGVLGNDTTDDILSATVLIGPSQGSLSLNADGSFRYTPDLNSVGEDAFVYQATDSNGASVAAIARIVVQPINDRPLAEDDDVTTIQDVPIVIDVLANDLDVDGELLRNAVRVVNEPTRGTSFVDAISGQVTYVPNGGFVGRDSLTYEVCDDAEPPACGIATIHVEVRLPNTTPEAVDDSATTNEELPILIDVLANDVDQDGHDLTVTDFTQGSHGAVTEGVDGLTYSPEPNYFGSDTFIYKISDGYDGTATARVRIEVQSVNDVPQAISETYLIRPNRPFTLIAPGVLANDLDADGDILTATLERRPAFGRVELREDGSFVYAATVGGQVRDRFTYVAQDGSSTSEVATVEIIVGAESLTIGDSEPCRTFLEFIGDEGDPKIMPYRDFAVSCVELGGVSAGGPYVINLGDSLALHGSVASDFAVEPIEFSWDIDGDGTFDDAVGAEAYLSWDQLQLLGIDDAGIFGITMRADDANGDTREAPAVLVVTNAAPEIIVDPTTGLDTSEDGGMATFNVVLTSSPTADVRVTLQSSDLSEGTVSPDELVFTVDNWHVPQQVEVTGVDDLTADGPRAYRVVTGWATSEDERYHGFDPDDVSLVNWDNDPDILVVPVTAMLTSEQGGTAEVSLVLTTAPTDVVMVRLFSSNTREGTLDRDVLQFDVVNWSVPQVVTVTGQPDEIADGDQRFHIVTAWATSLDRDYHGINPEDVELWNVEAAPVPAAAYVGSTDWAEAFYQQLADVDLGDAVRGFRLNADQASASVPWARVDILSIVVPENVVVGASQLEIVPLDPDQRRSVVAEYTFDLTRRTATWRLSEPLSPGGYLARIEGYLGDSDNTRTIVHLSVTPGDYDGDGVVTNHDVDLLQRMVHSGLQHPYWDVDGSSQVDVRDVQTMIVDLVGTSVGDANLDGFVDWQDHQIVSANGLSAYATWSQGDFNSDGNVDHRDLDLLRQNQTHPGDVMAPVGDINLDGVLTTADIDAMRATRHSGILARRADLDYNGVVDWRDEDLLIRGVFGTVPGDANLDRVVDGQDFAAWSANRFSRNTRWSRGDYNGDLATDVSDFNVWIAYRFDQANPAPAAGALGSTLGHRLPRAPLPVDDAITVVNPAVDVRKPIPSKKTVDWPDEAMQDHVHRVDGPHSQFAIRRFDEMFEREFARIRHRQAVTGAPEDELETIDDLFENWWLDL